jgi:hypothetical protein
MVERYFVTASFFRAIGAKISPWKMNNTAVLDRGLDRGRFQGNMTRSETAFGSCHTVIVI